MAVKTPATSHEVQWGKIEAWLQSAGKPNEQAMKGRLRDYFAAEQLPTLNAISRSTSSSNVCDANGFCKKETCPDEN